MLDLIIAVILIVFTGYDLSTLKKTEDHKPSHMIESWGVVILASLILGYCIPKASYDLFNVITGLINIATGVQANVLPTPEKPVYLNIVRLFMLFYAILILWLKVKERKEHDLELEYIESVNIFSRVMSAYIRSKHTPLLLPYSEKEQEFEIRRETAGGVEEREPDKSTVIGDDL